MTVVDMGLADSLAVRALLSDDPFKHVLGGTLSEDMYDYSLLTCICYQSLRI